MANIAGNLFIVIVVFIVLLIGVVLLQIFLSKGVSKWPGLVLPGIALLYSLLMVLNLTAFAGMTTAEIALSMLATFLMCNIPTAVLLVIYFVCRGGDREKKELEKMNVQDLE